jgi:hypothetical protein
MTPRTVCLPVGAATWVSSAKRLVLLAFMPDS